MMMRAATVTPISLLNAMLLASITLCACAHGQTHLSNTLSARRLLNAPADAPPTPLAVPPIDPLPAPLAPVILPPPDAAPEPVPAPVEPAVEPPVAAVPPVVPVEAPPVVVLAPPTVVPPVVDPSPPLAPVPTAEPPVATPTTPLPDPVPPVHTLPPAPVPDSVPSPTNQPPEAVLPPVSIQSPAAPEANQSPDTSPAPAPQGSPDEPADANPAGAKPPPPPVPTLSPSGTRTNLPSVTGEDATQSSKGGGMSKPALAFTIIGALVGGLALVGIIIFCCVCYRAPTPSKSFISPEYTTQIDPVAPPPLQATSYMTYDAASSLDSRMPKDEYEFPPGHPGTGSMAVASQHMETLEEEQPPRFGNRVFSALTGSRNNAWDNTYDSTSSSRSLHRERAATAVAHFKNTSQPLDEPPQYQYQRKYGAY